MKINPEKKPEKTLAAVTTRHPKCLALFKGYNQQGTLCRETKAKTPTWEVFKRLGIQRRGIRMAELGACGCVWSWLFSRPIGAVVGTTL